MKKFRIYDNGGKSFDRFTFVIREKDSETLHFWGSSEKPFDPQGFGQYCGSSEDYTPCIPGAHLGSKVRDFSTLPESVKGYFAQCVRNCDWDFHADCKGVLS